MPSIFYPARPPSSVEVAAVVAPFGADAAARVRAALANCPEHRATPLRRLADAAREWGLREIRVKDERARLGLRSFKAIGGAYAVLRLSARMLPPSRGGEISIADLLRRPKPILPDTTFTAATAGNHGCAVAAGARLVGAHCRIFIADGVPSEQIAAIRAQDADIVSVSGSYEDALRACSRAAESNGWIAVSDCATERGDATVGFVMEGYTAIAAELFVTPPPSHLFLQAGVGGMAAAIAAHLHAVLGERAPRFVIVEPESAACLLASARADRAVEVPRGAGTNMGRLECYAPSAAAWPVLRVLASAYATVTDAEAETACDLLAQHDLATTPSGAAGLAALSRIMASPDDRARLHLGPDSDVLVVVTEAPLRAAAG